MTPHLSDGTVLWSRNMTQWLSSGWLSLTGFSSKQKMHSEGSFSKYCLEKVSLKQRQARPLCIFEKIIRGRKLQEVYEYERKLYCWLQILGGIFSWNISTKSWRKIVCEIIQLDLVHCVVVKCCLSFLKKCLLVLEKLPKCRNRKDYEQIHY